MTKIAIEPNASGTGTFTIAAPNSNDDRTLTLPDAAGEVLTDQSDLGAANLTGDVAAARITTALNAGGSAPIFACRAWVNFDGTTTPPTIRASGNVSSVTRNGTGDYTVNFATAMPDTNYAALISQSRDNGPNPPTPASTQNQAGTASTLKTTTQCRFGTGGNTASYNATQISIAIFR